ncbi:hypothetical protein KDA82_10345, partial [Streptomyces daliensis]|nr:hypothetical protein [Streptomyces daliensis]
PKTSVDPDPERSAWVQPFMRADRVPVLGFPAELWAWAEEFEEREAREHIKGGHPLFETFPDADCTYSLSVWPVHLRSHGPPYPLPEPQTHRVGGLSHPLYVLAEDPWR